MAKSNNAPPEILTPLRPLSDATPVSTQIDAPKKRGRGKPVELTVEIGRKIVGAIAAGNFPDTAARLAGVSTPTVEKWLKRGDRGDPLCKEFADAYRKAELEGESALVEIWKTAAPGDWRAAKELLAKRHPERWSDHAAKLAVLGPEDSRRTSGLQIFEIQIISGDPESQRLWDEHERQHTLAQQPAAIEVKRDKDPDPNLN